MDRPIVITTLATANYLPRAQWCINYLDKHAEIAYLGAVGCDPCGEMELGHVGCYLVPAGMLDRSLGNPGNGCIQHGSWLPYLPADDASVIICIDGDVKMQRPFSEHEREWLANWQDGQIGIGPNEPGDDNMMNELYRIKPLHTHEEIAKMFSVSAADPIGNAGCVVATRKTWIDLWLCYLKTWLETAPHFGDGHAPSHQATQQVQPVQRGDQVKETDRRVGDVESRHHVQLPPGPDLPAQKCHGENAPGNQAGPHAVDVAAT